MRIVIQCAEIATFLVFQLKNIKFDISFYWNFLISIKFWIKDVKIAIEGILVLYSHQLFVGFFFSFLFVDDNKHQFWRS